MSDDYIAGLVQRGIISPDVAQRIQAPMQAIADRHQQEGQQVKSAAWDVALHPQDYIQPGPGEIGMARPWGYWGNEGLSLLRRAVEAGKTQSEIAAEHGLDQSTVAQLMKKYGLQSPNARGPRPKSDADIAKLKALIDQGETWQSIADKLGKKSPGSVRNLAGRYGLGGNAPDWLKDEMKQ